MSEAGQESETQFGSGHSPLCIVSEEPDVLPCRGCDASRALIAGKEPAVPQTGTLLPLPPKEPGKHRLIFPQTRPVQGTTHRAATATPRLGCQGTGAARRGRARL